MQAILNQRSRNQKHFKREVQALSKSYTKLSKEQLDKTVPFLSEGQIPRHDLLYAFDVKKYGNMNDVSEVVPNYGSNLKPSKDYLRKFFISSNAHSLFCSEDKPLSIVEFNKKFSEKLIEKPLLGRWEFSIFLEMVLEKLLKQ